MALNKLGNRSLNDLSFQGRDADGSRTLSGLGDVTPSYRMRPITASMDSSVQITHTVLQISLVIRNCQAIPPQRRPSFLPGERPEKRGEVDVMQKGCEPRSLRPLCGLVHPGQVGRQGSPARVLTLASCPGVPSGRSLPPSCLVAFDRVTGTTPWSATPLRLGAGLRLSLALRPLERTVSKPLRGFLGSNEILSYVICSQTPVER